jgi:hypothetical protein
MMLEGIKILGERIVNMPELYDPNENRVTEIKMTDPEIPTSHQVDQLIQLVCENADGIFTDEEVKYIKDSIAECRRRVFNSDQDLILPRTRQQMKAELEHEEEERKWRMEQEKERRQREREKQLAMEQIQQRMKHDEMLRGGRGIASNSLTGGIF